MQILAIVNCVGCRRRANLPHTHLRNTCSCLYRSMYYYLKKKTISKEYLWHVAQLLLLSTQQKYRVSSVFAVHTQLHFLPTNHPTYSRTNCQGYCTVQCITQVRRYIHLSQTIQISLSVATKLIIRVRWDGTIEDRSQNQI